MAFHSYQEWRDTIPWTDEEILSALRESTQTLHAEWLRNGAERTADYFDKTRRLSSKILGYALPHLVKTCAICGKKALYRTGTKGRCSEHRLVPDAAIQRAKQERDRAALERDRMKTSADDQMLSRERLRRVRQPRK